MMSPLPQFASAGPLASSELTVIGNKFRPQTMSATSSVKGSNSSLPGYPYCI